MTRRRKGVLAVGLTLALTTLVLVPGAHAQPTHDEVEASVAAGVDWLVLQQDPDGSWGNWEECAVTALAVKKLMHHAVDEEWGLGLPSPFDDANPYKANIELGLSWMFDNCAGLEDPILPQPAGDPDSDGDDLGVWFGAVMHHRAYTSGITLMTLCETVELDRVVETGVLTGWTYEEVARDLMDYLAWGQNDAGWQRGGWGYFGNDAGWSDNSNSGYVTLGLGFAGARKPVGCAFELPQFVLDELNVWIDYIQNPVDGDVPDGGSGYTGPNNWVNILKTGNLLQQMSLVGDTAATGRVQDALDYLERLWNDPTWDPGWRGGAGIASYQATFTTMKGLTALEIEEFGALPIDWAADFETALLAEQNPDGSWPRSDWDFGWPDPPILSTIWALLTLQRVAPPPPAIPVPVDVKPQSCRNPLNVGARGVLPVAVLGTGDFDVTHLDPATILLEGVSPLRWSLEDVATPYEPFLGKEGAHDCTDEGPDGYLDLALKFKHKEVVAALGPVTDGDVLVLTLTGNLRPEFNGTAVIGEDVVVILQK